MIVYISIGNSDDKLSQKQWVDFLWMVGKLVDGTAGRGGSVHGKWYSPPESRWQNACWCVEFDPDLELIAQNGDVATNLVWLRKGLAKLAATYGQDSIAWAEVPRTEFIKPAP